MVTFTDNISRIKKNKSPVIINLGVCSTLNSWIEKIRLKMLFNKEVSLKGSELGQRHLINRGKLRKLTTVVHG